jgi:hypothetical protein
MTVPITPTPPRPVDDAIIETAWGAWVHDVALSLPRGMVAESTLTAGIPNFNSTQVTLVTLSSVPVEAGRLYNLDWVWEATNTDTADVVCRASIHFTGTALKVPFSPSGESIVVDRYFGGSSTGQGTFRPVSAGAVTIALRAARQDTTLSLTASRTARLAVSDVGADPAVATSRPGVEEGPEVVPLEEDEDPLAAGA